MEPNITQPNVQSENQPNSAPVMSNPPVPPSMPTPPQAPAPVQYNTPIQNMVEDSKRDSKIGPLVGSIIIIILIVVGALYFWGSMVAERAPETQRVPAQPAPTGGVQGSLDADLQAN